MGLASQKFYNAADGCWYEITPTLQNDKWITVHPNGEGTKGQPLLIKDGETPSDAIQRKFHPKQKELFGKDVDLGKTDYKKVDTDDEEEQDDSDRDEEQYRAYEYKKQKESKGKKTNLMDKFKEVGTIGFKEASFTYKGAKIKAKERLGNVYGDIILPDGKIKQFDTTTKNFESKITNLITEK